MKHLLLVALACALIYVAVTSREAKPAINCQETMQTLTDLYKLGLQQLKPLMDTADAKLKELAARNRACAETREAIAWTSLTMAEIATRVENLDQADQAYLEKAYGGECSDTCQATVDYISKDAMSKLVKLIKDLSAIPNHVDEKWPESRCTLVHNEL